MRVSFGGLPLRFGGAASCPMFENEAEASLLFEGRGWGWNVESRCSAFSSSSELLISSCFHGSSWVGRRNDI
jgi:hypothetical protein